uniref:hypothetical protein n=1 Tax=Phocaeicola vulgatus TaxID=821 RepID=UPI003FED75CE
MFTQGLYCVYKVNKETNEMFTRKEGNLMSEEKRELIKDVTSRLGKLPVEKQNYLLGYMNGVIDSTENTSTKKEIEVTGSD